MIFQWFETRLDQVKDYERIIVQDHLQLLSPTDSNFLKFIQEHAFTLIVASTNLVFRDLYESALQNSNVKKLLFIDRSPKRRQERNQQKAPPAFYPDLWQETPPEARIVVDLRQFP